MNCKICNASSTETPFNIETGLCAFHHHQQERLNHPPSSLKDWIPIDKQRPPLTAETPETDGFFLLLRHNPNRDAVRKYRMHVWFGSVPTDATHWARIPAFPSTAHEEEPDPYESPEYAAFVEKMAERCEREDGPCDGCLAGSICDGPDIHADEPEYDEDDETR